MASLQPYYIKTIVYCASEKEAQDVQIAVSEITKGVPIKGSDLLNFYSHAKANMPELRRIIADVVNKGLMSLAANAMAIKKLLKK